MNIIADLHLHSKFSRAVSRDMTIPEIARWAGIKGIGLVATGDWTHPLWLTEIQKYLKEDGTGILKLKASKQVLVANENLDAPSVASAASLTRPPLGASEVAQNFVRSQLVAPSFILSTELSCIYSQSGKTRRVHVLVWVPTIASAIKINKELTKRGCNVLSDGRPILGLSLIDLAELILTAEPKALIVPAHIWTPWFSVYGKMGGFETLEEAFGTFAKYIYAVETGLSSSPDMNWRIKELDTRAIVSFSDAHSGAKLGREATVFNIQEISFSNICTAIKATSRKTEVRRQKSDKKVPTSDLRSQSSNQILYTIEFYPEEGKYHYTGHRDCNVRLTPEEVLKKGTTCSVCGKPLTQGVMQRVEELATRTSNEIRETRYEKKRPPFVMSVPLMEIIAEAIGSSVVSKKTIAHYNALTHHFKGEIAILMTEDVKEIARISTPQIADGIQKVRTGDIMVDPGYDGVFGVVKIWKSEGEKALVDRSKEQLSLIQ